MRKEKIKQGTTLLLALPEGPSDKFLKMIDAKEMVVDAIKSRFGGNDESKKMQKYILKQQFKGFSISNTEGLRKGYDRFQSILSQLEIHGAGSTAHPLARKNVALFRETPAEKAIISTAKEPVGFADRKPKLKATFSNKTGLFARKCNIKGNQDNRRRIHGISGNKNGRQRTRKKEDSKALVTMMERKFWWESWRSDCMPSVHKSISRENEGEMGSHSIVSFDPVSSLCEQGKFEKYPMSKIGMVNDEQKKGIDVIMKKDSVTQTTQPPPTKGKKKIEEDDESESESSMVFLKIEKNSFHNLQVMKKWLGKYKNSGKARIETDRLLAEKLQEEKGEQFTIEERAKFLLGHNCCSKKVGWSEMVMKESALSLANVKEESRGEREIVTERENLVIDDEDKFGNSQQDWNIVSWKLHGSSAILQVSNVAELDPEDPNGMRKEVFECCFKVEFSKYLGFIGEELLVQNQTSLVKGLFKLFDTELGLHKESYMVYQCTCYDNVDWLRPKANEQTAMSKGTSNPLWLGLTPSKLVVCQKLQSQLSWIVAGKDVAVLLRRQSCSMKIDSGLKVRLKKY
ncbi:hypothetical protein Tco_0315806 [Tanacetum coccineum]